MTFSYLRAYAKTKRNTLLTSYLVSGVINIALVACWLLPTTPYLVTLRLVLLLIEVLFAVLTFIGGTYAEEILQKNIAKKDYTSLISYTQIYNFLDKWSLFDSIYSFCTFCTAVASMIAIGWVWQTVFFILVQLLGIFASRAFINNLPSFVKKLDLNEGDFE